MLNDKNMKAIEADLELQTKLRELWKKEAPVSDFYDLLSSEGFDVTMENLEDIHADLQKRRGEAIAAADKLDPEQLRRVAGGGTGNDCTGAGDCDSSFKDYPDMTDRCSYSSYCDELFSPITSKTRTKYKI